jgi:hypothetical protein
VKGRTVDLGIALYPVAALIVFPLHLWAISGVSPQVVVRPIVLMAVVGLVVVVLSRVATRDKHLGGVVALIVLGALLVGGRQPGAALAMVAGMGGVLWLATRPRALDWAWVGRQLSRLVAVVALAVVIEAATFGRADDAFASASEDVPPSFAAAPSTAPDVFLILLDGYPRHDMLRSAFAVDDSPFLNGLVQRGFEVAPESHSNYLVTNLSVPSFLNFRHIADLTTSTHRAAAHPAVIEAFRALGYESIAIASGFEDSAVRTADRFLDGGQINNFDVAVLEPTLVAAALTAANPDAFSSSQRDRIDWSFRTLGNLAAEQSSRPRFIFAHIPSPHRPWVVDGAGNATADPGLETWYYGPDFFPELSRAEKGARLGGQVQDVGRRMLQALDEILDAAARPPVILVVSDHGMVVDRADENTELRLRNLFAVYTPGRSGLFPRDTTLVNVFPTIFDAYLNTTMQRVPEDLYVAGPGGLADPVRITP